MSATESDLVYLRILDKAGARGFAPIGWLYARVYEDLQSKGLCVWNGGGYCLTRAGRDALAK